MNLFKKKNKNIETEKVVLHGGSTSIEEVEPPTAESQVTKQENLPAVKKNRWGCCAGLVFFILIIGAAVAVYRFAQKPAEGVINASLPDAEVATTVSDVPATFTGTYVSFMCGNKYVLKSDDLSRDSSDVILERAYLTESSNFSKKINLTIRSLPSQNLTDDPDYSLRQNTPARYKKENFSLGSVSGVSFVPADNGSFEKTFFILHKDVVATLVMTAPGSLDETLSREADGIAKSLTWLK
ncbi:MAG: hypothetical protein P4L62_02695 [Candidatus Pacebacteria bacterium]|nr:hypothetical protein [Candidatus Paceibacterota bacterium]MDR3583241.1 hypothetical protein [Candidatus Paceibacterota bacterium]